MTPAWLNLMWYNKSSGTACVCVCVWVFVCFSEECISVWFSLNEAHYVAVDNMWHWWLNVWIKPQSEVQQSSNPSRCLNIFADTYFPGALRGLVAMDTVQTTILPWAFVGCFSLRFTEHKVLWELNRKLNTHKKPWRTSKSPWRRCQAVDHHETRIQFQTSKHHPI